MTLSPAYHLRRALEARGWTAARLARELGAGPSTVRAWLTGRHAPRGAALTALRRVLPELSETAPGGAPKEDET